MISGIPWVLRPMTLKLGCPRGPAGVARAAMKPLSSRIADESPVATTNTLSAVSQVVVKTARNPNELNHNRSTKKRLNTKNPTNTAMIDAASMSVPFFMSEYSLEPEPRYIEQ